MAPNHTNTTQGTNAEHLLLNSLPKHKRAFGIIKEIAGVPIDAKLASDGEVVGNRKRKTDVEFWFLGDYPALRITVKSFDGRYGYNHLQRTSLSNFCSMNRISSADESFLGNLFLRKAAKNKGRRSMLVNPEEQDRVREIFKTVEIGISSFLGSDHPQILALYCVRANRWNLYDMQKTILPLIRADKIGFTARGGNVEIGSYVVFQRKGSAKGEQGISSSRSVDDIKHRANDVQIKFRTLKFYENVTPDAYYQL